MTMARKSPVFWAVGLLCLMPVVAVAVLSFSGGFEVKELPILGKVPDFVLTERNGTSFDSQSLRGKVWVAGFLFTGCNMQCPMIISKFQKLQHKFRLKDRWRALAFTTNPEMDTPEVLAAYAEKAKADPYKWLFLTGEKKSLGKLISGGFRLANDENDPTIHSEKLVLVDHGGRIRGYYDASDDSQVNQLMKDTRALLKQAF